MTSEWGAHPGGTRRDPVDGGDGGTRRDGLPAGADGGTRRDPVDGGGTRRDGETQADAAQAPFVRVVLPPLLASRFSVVAELHASGAEADVVLADERSSGRRMVVKLYRRGVAADEEAVARLARADRRHVVEVVDRGWEEGCWFEALEYCEQGSLRSLMEGGATPAVDDVVREVAAALEHVHGLGLVHRDLKPENVLVRRASPLDLVLCDFGLVRVVDASVRWTRAWGTPAYSPPEFEGGEVSPAWDWWSLGMIAAELAGGRHPFELPGGQMMADQQMRAWLAQRPVDLSAVTDPRAALLCRGLLVPDRRDRWGASQVAAWLGGESPAVADDRPTAAPAPRARRVLFAGVELSTPAELAAAFQRQWGEAFRRLFQERDPGLIEETERLLRQHGLDEALRLLAPGGSAADLPRRFATLLGEMDPELDPVFNAVRLTEGGLEAAALEILQAGGDHPATSVLDEVRRRGVLIAWRSLPGMGHGPRTHEAWVASCGELENVVAPLRDAGFQPDAADWARARAWLLLCALDPERHTAQLRAALEGLDDSLARERPWWAQLRESADAEAGAPARLAAAHVALPTATEQAHVAREQARQAEAAAKERQRREAEERRRQEAEARRARQRQRQQSRARLLFWTTIPGTVLLVMTLILIALTYFGDLSVANAAMEDAPDFIAEFHSTWRWTDSALDVLTWEKSRLATVGWASAGLAVAGLASVLYSDSQGWVSPTAVTGVASAMLGYGAAIVMLPWVLVAGWLLVLAVGVVLLGLFVLWMICQVLEDL